MNNQIVPQTEKLTNRMTAVIAGLVILIGAVAFVLSYEALSTIAAENGYSGGILAYLWPILIDAPLIVFTLALLSAQLTRRSIRLWAGLVILYTLATIAFNLAHAEPTPLGWAVAIAAPVGLLLTTEALRSLARDHIERGHAVVTLADLDKQTANARVTLDKLNGQIDNAMTKLDKIKAQSVNDKRRDKADKSRDKVGARRDKVLSLLDNGLSEHDIADKLGVSLRTVQRDTKALNGRVRS